jgi:hypothetical protein
VPRLGFRAESSANFALFRLILKLALALAFLPENRLVAR